MNNDRELLELAAKAARLDLTGAYAIVHDRVYVFYRALPDGPPIAWNPLTDDGDALRLAVKLGIGLEFVQGILVIAGRRNHEDRRDHNDDLNTTTRRAIVRAAAEIGKEMK